MPTDVMSIPVYAALLGGTAAGLVLAFIGRALGRGERG
jgi:hypothetical protein